MVIFILRTLLPVLRKRLPILRTPLPVLRTPFVYTPGNDYKLRVTITILRVTITIPPMFLKTQKALIFRVLLGIKKTETPIFQGISAVLPKLYLGGGRDRSRNIDSIH